MELIQRPSLRQKVTLSPQVYQGLSILAMPVAELAQLVEAEMLENPTLEVEELESEAEEAPEEREERDAEDERAWDEWLEMYDDLDASETNAPRDPNAEAVNTDGFFDGLLSEIALQTGVSSKVVDEALKVVQQLDPPGVGAIDLAGALCLQMEYLEINEPLLDTIVRDHLDDIAANHYRKVARLLKVDEAEVRRVVEIMRTLNPRPAGAFSPGPSPGYIVPDLTLRRFDDDWLIIPNNEAAPALRVSPRYRPIASTASGGCRCRDRGSLVHRESRRDREVHGHPVRSLRAETFLLRRLSHEQRFRYRGHEHQATAT
jgi:RNA polymerase sigma-54 factor